MATDAAPGLRPDSEPHRETDDRETEPVDYAALNAIYAVLLAGVLYATRERAREDPITNAELIPISAATFALAKVVAREKIGTWLREPFVEVRAGERRPAGHGMRAAVGELVTCTRCVGAWSAMTIVGLRLAQPQAGRAATSILAASAANDFLQAGFSWLRRRAG